MKPDPSRQWFVYFKERELGPFPEGEVQQKFRTGEFDKTAYVFSEGMTDWVLINDAAVLHVTTPQNVPPSSVQEGTDSTRISAGSASHNPDSKLTQVSKSFGSGRKNDLSSGATVVSQSLASSTQSDVRPDPSISQSASGISKSKTPAGGPVFSEHTSTASKTTPSREEIPLPAQSEENVQKSVAAKKSKKKGPQLDESSIKPSRSLPKIRPFVWVIASVIILCLGAYEMLPNLNWRVSRTLTEWLGHKKQPAHAGNSELENENPSEGDGAGTTAPEAKNSLAPGDGATENTSGTRAGHSLSSDPEWNELLIFRNSKDSRGAPYRVTEKPLGGRHPVVVGVLSSLLKADKVALAIFPDNDKNLMAIPRVWTAKIPVIDGFFSYGPLSVDGNDLPPGRYRVFVELDKTFLGETAFELGPFPTGAQLTQAQADLQNERTALAEKEHLALDMKLREVKSTLDQLKTQSHFASQGPRGARDWKRVVKPWRENLSHSTTEQRNLMSGPMFYPESQFKLHNFMKDILGLSEALDIFSAGGARALQKAHKHGLGSLWAELAKEQADLESEVRTLGQNPITPFKIDPEIIKVQLATEGSEK